MKFGHVVNYNGIYYAAGEEVPIPEEGKTQETSEPLKEEVAVEEEVVAPKRRGRKPREV